MGNESGLPELAQRVAYLVRTVMSEVRPKLVQAALSGNQGENTNLRHADNFLSTYDMWMHRRYRQLLEASMGSFVYASEEADPQVIGDDSEPDLCVLVDPLDTSELAVRGLHGYTHIMIYSRVLARPIVAVIGDIFHHLQLYVGARDEDGQDSAFLISADLAEYPLRQPSRKSLPESLITNYLMRPAERFVPLTRQKHLLRVLSEPAADGKRRGRIGVDFGSVGLCHVAAGFTDAMVEFAKGFAIWDLSPGHYVLHSAGGVVLNLQGLPLPLDYRLDSLDDIAHAMNVRQKFVAAGNIELAQQIVGALAFYPGHEGPD